MMSDFKKPPRAVLDRAIQTGDRQACEEVTLYAFREYESKLNKLKPHDQILSYDDMRTTFYEGILRHMPKLDYRGDPYQHLAWRGYLYVLSEIRATAKHVKDRTYVERLDEQIAHMEDWDGIDARQDAARELGQIMKALPATSPERKLMKVAISGVAGDPLQKGYNKRLAQALDISPQRASQIMAKLQQAASDSQN